MKKVVHKFLGKSEIDSIENVSGGLIHQTFKVKTQNKEYILQRFNKKAFKNPEEVAVNIQKINDHLNQQDYALKTPDIIKTLTGDLLHRSENGDIWRMFSFIENSVCHEVADELELFSEAGEAYGAFISALQDMPPESLHTTIPDFHNIKNRFEFFLETIDNANSERLEQAESIINDCKEFYNNFSFDTSKLPVRVVHNDTKLSNILFDKDSQKAVAVIDLDIVMPGSVITDFGDMVRAMCNSTKEDEADTSKVVFLKDRYDYILKGFLASVGEWTTPEERDNLANGAFYIILEQTIRFLSDYLDNDQYYPVSYPLHNLDRANNQLAFLKSMISQIQIENL